MSRSLFLDSRLVALYDTLYSWGRCENFYIHLAGGKPCRILDVGCGTGRLACHLATLGHSVTGLDPSEEMLTCARQRSGGNDVEWIKGGATDGIVGNQFDLIIMTGHVFQVLLTDQDMLDALRHLRSYLLPSGRLAFETRNKKVCEWVEWTPSATREVLEMPGVGHVEVHNDIQSVSGSVVTYETHFSFDGADAIVTKDAIRFVDSSELNVFLVAAGFSEVTCFGDWDKSELTPSSPEIIVVAS